MKQTKLLNKYLDLPIRFKILLWFIPLLLATIAITGWYSYYTAKNQVLDKINLAQQEYTNQISNQLDFISNDALDFTNYLFLLSSVQQFLNPITQEDSLYRRQQINEIVSSLLVNQRDIQSLVLYGYNEEVPPLAINQTGLTSTMPFSKFKETQHYQLAIEQKGKPSWTLLTGNEDLFEGDHGTKIILTRVIKNSYTLDDLGVIIIGINEKTLRRKYTEGLSNNGQMFIVNKDNKVITSTDPIWIDKDIDQVPYIHRTATNAISLTNNNWMIAQSEAQNGWKVILGQPRKELLEELNTIKIWTFLLSAICSVIGVWFSWYVASIITKPLHKLTKSMYKVQEGDFNQRVEFRGKDEVGELGKGYDMMVQRISRLIDDVYRSRLSQKEAELKSLQAQINPHFLYNTLDTMFWMAQKKDDKDIADMIYSLSQIFRLSLSDGKEFVTIGNELSLIENYLTLQKSRFFHKFEFEIQASEAVQDIYIPKLLIQPLVENAVIHGIESLDEDGFIYIHVIRESNNLLIHVMDNGNGIPKEKLHHLNEYLQTENLDENTNFNPENRPGYAIMNIIERLKIKYGNRADMVIDSDPGVGTKVKIRIPLSTPKQDSNELE
ncbi:sensor histidine kinase [Aquibacillus koreensis]|uniref:histidine kinase n=1 Tax=Aquibacillus koreensis TaxID=279446 RepID=A0A9X3WMF7_9BACI|nr:sensor histidine kinase [Aquibacillus koreensis]MCT2537073.1 sensor histidine kinase [Aquibacillus koreensis]MDC3419944.1 sensor histidine kinase [Aquibacillus koreensis]